MYLFRTLHVGTCILYLDTYNIVYYMHFGLPGLPGLYVFDLNYNCCCTLESRSDLHVVLTNVSGVCNMVTCCIT